MAVLPISFAQTFSLLKGANYSNRIVFKPFTTSIASVPFSFQHVPLYPNYLPDGLSVSSNTYPRANSTNTYNSLLTFKHGGRLIDTEVGLFHTNNIKSVTVAAGSPKIFFGDFYVLLSAPAINASGNYYLESNNFLVSEALPNLNSSRSALLYAPLSGTAATEGSYQSNANGYYSVRTGTVTNPMHMYWKGNVKPLPTKSSTGDDNNSVITDYRIFVGIGRDHTNVTTTYHPQVGGTPRPAGFDVAAAVFMSFDDVNDGGKPKWWALLRVSDLAGNGLFFSAPTGLSIYSTNELEVVVSSSKIEWIANQTVVYSHTINPALYLYDTNSSFIGSSIRALKYLLSGNTVRSNCPAQIVTQALTVRRENSLSTPLVDVELGLHDTGLRLLKKLK